MARGTATSKAKSDPRTWIVVADGAHARIIESDGTHPAMTIRLETSAEARATAGKLAADRLPRTQESHGSARHGIAPRLGLKENAKRAFVARLAGYLAGGRGNYDRITLVAPARIARLLTQSLPAAVAGKITSTHRKDMTWMPEAEILKRVGFAVERRRA